jgi:spermidine synthase
VKPLIAATLAAIAAVLGWTMQDRPYRLQGVMFGQQAALDHRDSAYSSITWVVSETDNFQQLRFFDRVEGGICLRPSWGDLIALAGKEPTLAHLVPAPKPPLPPGGATWPHPWVPDPGALTNSAYIRLFPTGVLMNQALMAKAGGDFRQAAPHVLVVGLGSGIGLAALAYHFPQAAITVVDIDQVVVDMVRAHFPLLSWLSTQKTADGSPRVRFVVHDAREFIRYQAAREATARPYDLVILDAYTSGSTIPPHLMTLEFFKSCVALLGEDGILAANVIGSYTGEKSKVVGGAIRTFRAAGMASVRCFPVLTPGEGPANMDARSWNRTRNNFVLSSKRPLDPQHAAAGWERLRTFNVWPELQVGAYVSGGYLLIDRQKKTYVTGVVPAAAVDAAVPGLRARLVSQNSPGQQVMQYPMAWFSEDSQVVDQVYRAVDELVRAGKVAATVGWAERAGDSLHLRETDWVAAARETFRLSVITARDENHDGDNLVGPQESERQAAGKPTWIIKEAPLYTDQMPNADIYNN